MKNVCATSNIRVVPLLTTLLASSAPSIAVNTSSPSEQEFDAVIRIKANAAHGEQLFDTCAACHGSKGSGASDGTVPAIAGQYFRVVVWELVSFRRGGRVEPRMEHFTDEHHLSGVQDIADVATYVSHLSPWPSSTHGDGEHTAYGAEIYKRDCSSCHGVNAEGDRKRNPRLAGQHYEYLLRQLHDGVDGQRSNFSASHVQLLRRFQSQDLAAVCDYVSRLKP